ncbi:MBL fold metallo-hydrolase [Candidatus Woesearchaeota archaeon]|nr:MBL fold metallo-hydrolase [Candidatus Woesearchaeota archaeon]
MSSSIIFLGTGGDSVVTGKQLRASGGFILKVGELQFHVDPGPGALVRAHENGINLRANTAVLSSHNHLNHAADLNAVIDAMTYGGLDKKGILVGNKTTIEGSQAVKPYLTDFHKNLMEKVIVLSNGKRIAIENVEIEALPANHSDPDTVGFKFYTPEFILSYSSDTTYSRDLVNKYKGSDILLLNVVGPQGEKMKNHLNSDDAIKIIDKVNPKLAVITHFGIKMIKANPLYEGRHIQSETGIQVLAAKDGMRISPVSYSAKSPQKRIGQFEVEEKEEEQKESAEETSEKPDEASGSVREIEEIQEEVEENKEEYPEEQKELDF